METQLAVVKPEDLDVIVQQSGLEIQEGEAIKKSYQPFLNQLAEVHEQSTKINFTNPSELDMTIARNLRLKTVKIRTDSEKLKDARKRGYLLRGNLEQAAYNLIAATCKVAENEFMNVEKAREIAEAKRIEALRIERTAQLLRYEWVDSGVINVGKLDDATFNAMLAGLKKAQEDRIAEEKRIEAERVAKEKAEAEERAKIKAENERLKKEAEEKAKALALERAKAEAERKAAEEKARKEREKADEDRRIAAEKLAKEQAEIKRLSDALKAKQLQEEADRRRKEQEEAERVAAAQQAAAAPDKEKLLKMVDLIQMPDFEYKTAWGQHTEKVIRERFNDFKEWAKQLIDTQ